MEMILGDWDVGMIFIQIVSNNGCFRRTCVQFASQRLLQVVNEVFVEDDNCFKEGKKSGGLGNVLRVSSMEYFVLDHFQDSFFFGFGGEDNII